MSQTADYDVLIIGAGMVGSSLACALGGSPLRVALVEAKAPPTSTQHGFDGRSLALSYGSRRIFQGLGLWQSIRPEAEPIVRIHISDRGRFAAARLLASDHGVEALGYVAEIGALSAAVGRAARRHANVELLCPAAMEAVTFHPDGVDVHIRAGEDLRTVRTRLVVAADGADSGVRSHLGINARRWDYGQSALIANVEVSRPHGGTAYERFTDSGPMALLPLRGKDGLQRCALVWTMAPADAERALEWDEQEFRNRLQERFGFRAGRFGRIGRRQAHPLFLVRAQQQVHERLALIGNAAHTLHPVAGQGFNLGLRDVAALAELLVAAPDDTGAPAVLERYAAWRRSDQRTVIAFTDLLARTFTNPLRPVQLARDLALLAVDLLPPLKHQLERRTMGLAGRLPRLARGLPLIAGEAER